MFIFAILSHQTIYYNLSETYFNDDHTYEIRLLYTPLFCNKARQITKKLQVYHMGMGFVDIETGDERMIHLNLNTYNMNPDNWRFPEIVYNNDTELYDIKWFNYVNVMVMDEIQKGKCNWEQEVIVGEAPGNLLNEFVNTYAKDYDENYTKTYMPIELKWRKNGTYYNDLRSKECQDFAFSSIQYMATHLGINISEKYLVRNHVFVNIDERDGASAVRQLDMTNKDDNKIVTDFYKELQSVLSNRTIDEEIELYMSGLVYDLMGTKSHRYEWIHIIENNYYLVHSTYFPWVSFSKNKESLLHSN